MYQSQNNETQIALEYFGDNFKGNMLEIGANDGITLSNSYDLIKLGWSATLVEPSSVYSELEALHKGNSLVNTLNLAIGGAHSEMTLFESGPHVLNGKDKALVSTLDFEETQRWATRGVTFTQRKVKVVPFSSIFGQFDYISIDVEGLEWDILQQIDLNAVNCRLLCIEHNSKYELGKQFIQYCHRFGMILISSNTENLIFARP